MSEEKSIEKSFVVSHLIKQNKQLKQRIKELADNLEEAEDLHAEWKNEVAPKISELKQRNKDLEQAYTVLALKISQYLNGNLSVSAEDIKKEWKRGEQLLKGKSDG